MILSVVTCETSPSKISNKTRLERGSREETLEKKKNVSARVLT